MLDPKVLLQKRPSKLATVAIAACIGAGALYIARDRLHFQVGCVEPCEVKGQQTFLSAGLKSGPGQVYALQMVRRETAAIATETTTETTTSASALPSVSSSTDPFRDAVNAAMAAATQTQTAQQPEEWAEIARLWQQAIALMQAVPPDHPRHDLAQQKATEYGNNFSYAQQNAGSTWADASASDSSDVPTTNTAAAQPPESRPARPSSERPAPSERFTDWFEGKSGGLQLVLILLVGGGLATLFSFEPLSLLRRDQEIAAPPPPKPTRQPIPWGLVFSNAVHDLWDMQPFFNSERVYKMTAATSAHKLQRKLYRKLLNLTGDQSMALQLIKENLKRYPRQSANWCCEQAIRDLEKQRQRETRLRKPPEITEEPPPEDSGWV